MKIFMLPPTHNNPLWAGSPRPKGLRVPTSINPLWAGSPRPKGTWVPTSITEEYRSSTST